MVLALTMGRSGELAEDPRCAGRVCELDLYELTAWQLRRVSGLLIGMHCDQLFLARNQALIESFVYAGGRVAVSGQVVRPFMAGLSRFVPMNYSGVEDLTVYRLADHPVWRGVRPSHLTFRNGVAGFYGRGSYRPPAQAMVVNGLGPLHLPLDYHYRLGSGEVLVHGGNDLWGYRGAENTAARMTPQLLDWLVDR